MAFDRPDTLRFMNDRLGVVVQPFHGAVVDRPAEVFS